MSQRHVRTLEMLFAHPITTSIKWNDVVKMFEALGAEVEVAHRSHERVTLNGHDETFRIPRGSTIDRKEEVLQIRHFLERAGIAPGQQ